ncbi:hypothetical protein GW17_00027204, partial [Ensete ventricosum]
VFSRRFHFATFGERIVLSSSSPVLRRTLEEGFASTSSVAPNSPVRASGSFNRFGCLRVHCFPDRSIVVRNFLDPDENVDRCSYPRFGKGEEFYYDWLQRKLFNSMSKQKEVFKTRVEGQVSMYVCGIMPYDLSHIGHARAYVAFDVLHRSTSNATIISCQNLCITLSISRYLKHLGYEVKYVRNFTDIDDKVRSLFTLSC